MTAVYTRSHSSPDVWVSPGRPSLPAAASRETLVPGTYWPVDGVTSGVPAGMALTTISPGGTSPYVTINESYISANGGRSGDGRYYFERKDLHGALSIQAANVTVRYCRVRGFKSATGAPLAFIQAWGGQAGIEIVDCTMDPGAAGATAGQGGAHVVGANVKRCTIRNAVDGVTFRGGACQILANLVTDLIWYADDPNHSDGSHNDGFECFGGGPHTVRGNYVDMPEVGTAPMFVSQGSGAIVDPITIDRNYFKGGNSGINIAEVGQGAIQAIITDNTIGASGTGKDIIAPSTTRAISTITGNVKTNGTPAGVHNG